MGTIEGKEVGSNDPEMWDAYHGRRAASAVGALNALKTSLVCHLFAQRIRSMAGRFESVLELGVGTASTLDVLQRTTGARAVGIDRSDSAIRIASQQYPRLDLRVADMFALDLPEKSFDVVYSVGLLEHFTVPDQKRLLAVHARYARKYVVLMVPADGLLMNSILFVNKRVLGRSGYWADEDVFSDRILRARFPGTKFDVRWDRRFGNLILWFGFRPDDLVSTAG